LVRAEGDAKTNAGDTEIGRKVAPASKPVSIRVDPWLKLCPSVPDFLISDFPIQLRIWNSGTQASPVPLGSKAIGDGPTQSANLW
jgi:hypothetical protein